MTTTNPSAMASSNAAVAAASDEYLRNDAWGTPLTSGWTRCLSPGLVVRRENMGNNAYHPLKTPTLRPAVTVYHVSEERRWMVVRQCGQVNTDDVSSEAVAEELVACCWMVSVAGAATGATDVGTHGEAVTMDHGEWVGMRSEAATDKCELKRSWVRCLAMTVY